MISTSNNGTPNIILKAKGPRLSKLLIKFGIVKFLYNASKIQTGWLANFWVNGMVYEPNKVQGFSTLKPNLWPIVEILLFHWDLKHSKQNDDPIKEISLNPIVPEQLKMTRPRAFRIQ